MDDDEAAARGAIYDAPFRAADSDRPLQHREADRTEGTALALRNATHRSLLRMGQRSRLSNGGQPTPRSGEPACPRDVSLRGTDRRAWAQLRDPVHRALDLQGRVRAAAPGRRLRALAGVRRLQRRAAAAG